MFDRLSKQKLSRITGWRYYRIYRASVAMYLGNIGLVCAITKLDRVANRIPPGELADHRVSLLVVLASILILPIAISGVMISTLSLTERLARIDAVIATALWTVVGWWIVWSTARIFASSWVSWALTLGAILGGSIVWGTWHVLWWRWRGKRDATKLGLMEGMNESHM